MTAHQAIADLGQLLHVRAHHLGAQSAVHPDREKIGMRDRVVGRLDRLSRERARARVRDRDRSDDRNAVAPLLEHLVDRVEGSFEIERVEGGFDEQQIDSAVQQSSGFFVIGRAELLEGDVAERGTVDVGGKRRRAIGRAHRSGHELPCPVGAIPRWNQGMAALRVIRMARNVG